MTKELFREDGYLKQCDAKVIEQQDNKIALDQTVFYPIGGGQPGDTGRLVRQDGAAVAVLDTIKDRDSGTIWHIVDEEVLLEQGEKLSAEIDWARRYSLMRLHSCMHMLCAIVPAPVTGGSIRDEGTARLDFDLPEPPDKAALNDQLNALTSSDHAMHLKWITDEEMQAQADLVRTMSVKPPMGSGRVRLVEFAEVDLQPCGGTHVANSKEIGAVTIQSIKKKGKLNRRITIALS
jgi:misacylated tRNA(Ala) deacylase